MTRKEIAVYLLYASCREGTKDPIRRWRIMQTYKKNGSIRWVLNVHKNLTRGYFSRTRKFNIRLKFATFCLITIVIFLLVINTLKYFSIIKLIVIALLGTTLYFSLDEFTLKSYMGMILTKTCKVIYKVNVNEDTVVSIYRGKGCLFIDRPNKRKGYKYREYIVNKNNIYFAIYDYINDDKYSINSISKELIAVLTNPIFSKY